MATIIRQIYFGYRYINDELSDKRVQDLPLMGSPWIVIGILVFYLYFVHKLGPQLMANRKPFDIQRIMQIYNVVQIVLCSYVFYKAMTLAWLRDYKFACQPVDYSNTPIAIEIARTVWMYFMIKVLDLLDTIFFILRKKQNQVSFLHVYHHTGMVFGGWAAAKFLPGGQFALLGTVNSFVHIIMYSHYLATSLKLHKSWWKKYVTQLQLCQFFLLLFHYVVFLFSEDCGFPKWTAVVMIPQNLFMLVLFGDFYYKAYIKKRKTVSNGVCAEATNGKLKSR